MRRPLVIATLAATMLLAGCAPEAAPDATTAPEITPMPGGTYTASAAPSMAEIDLGPWSSRFLPEEFSASRKSELMHGGESESMPHTPANTPWSVQIGCAADSATSLTVTLKSEKGDAVTATVPCATGPAATPEMHEVTSKDDAETTITVAAEIDTAVALQVADAE